MSHHELLTSVRTIYVLAAKPGRQTFGAADYWAIPLGGLHREDLQAAVTALRKQRLSTDSPEATKRSLKPSALYDTLAQALGAKNYDDWIRDGGQLSRIVSWLAGKGMQHPRDLIRWDRSPRMAGKLTARQVADRLFNSQQPLPSRIFTGVGSKLFYPDAFGSGDLNCIANRLGRWDCEDEDYLALFLEHESEVIAESPAFDGSTPRLQLTGRQVLLNGLSECVASMYTMVGDTLCVPLNEPIFRSYNMTETERSFERAMFDVFRREIEQSEEGWVDVLPMPGNDNIIFLRGADGSFDWVVRDQRDDPFAPNPLHPIFKFHEVPTAMLQPQLKTHLYFSPGTWEEKLQHDAEVRHYSEGGKVGDWPGYERLVQQELIATRSYERPRPPDGHMDRGFVAHRLGGCCLMVSPLVTVDDFWKFYEGSDWKVDRHERARSRAMEIEEHLSPANFLDQGNAPVSVTWLDAVAYCRYYERLTGLPVRLLEVSEWKEIAPPKTIDLARARASAVCKTSGQVVPIAPIDRSSWRWCVIGGDNSRGVESRDRHTPTGTLRFDQELPWTQNAQGLPFLAAVDFGEWLSDHGHDTASAANAATGVALRGGPLERDRCPMWSTNKYKGLKTGFRMCYVARLDG